MMSEIISSFTRIEDIFLARPVGVFAMLVILIGIVALGAYLYRRSWGLNPVTRVFLGVARVIVIAIVALSLLEPTAVIKETETRLRGLPVLLDVSESMGMKDQRKRPEDIMEAASALGLVNEDDEKDPDRAVMALDSKKRLAITTSSRLDLAKSVLTKSKLPVFESLGEDLDLSYYAFGKSPLMISDSTLLQSKEVEKLNADQPITSIAESLDVVANSGNVTPAGIVLFSDGIDNDSPLRSEAILRDLGSRGIPVFPVAVGLTDPDDVSIRNIVMQEVASSGDSVPVRVQIQSKGYEKRTAKLIVTLNDQIVSQKEVRLDGGLQFEDINFKVVNNLKNPKDKGSEEKGAARVSVKIEPFNDEISPLNNQVERSIRIVNERVKVLYIEGNARWEFRYLSAILKRDPRMDVTFIASSVGPEIARNSPDHIERFPNKPEEAFKYDLVILGDTDAAFFKEDELKLLEELIRDRGASLLMLCGPMHSPLSYAGTPVESMLPVRFDSEGKWDLVPETVFPVLTPEGRSSMVMTMENKVEDNDRVWSRVAPLDHLPPLTGVKPGATVLATLSDSASGSQGYPLVAWQRYGTGKCMSLATDRLWRLRFNTGDKYHWRIWSQSIQFLTLSRLMGEHKRIRLETDRVVYPVGGQARLYAHVLDESYEPIMQPGFDVFVSPTDESSAKQRVTLRPDRTQPGLYEGYFSPSGVGRYRMEANEDDLPLSNTTEFQVVDAKSEMIDTDMRLAQMQRIAELTGGKCLTIDQIPQLDELVNKEPQTTTVRSERAIWDNGLISLLLIGLLGSEWLLRRKNDLP
jgi:hypothetical protein